MTPHDYVLVAAVACPWGAVLIALVAGAWLLRQLSHDGMSVVLHAPPAPVPSVAPVGARGVERPEIPPPSLRRSTSPPERERPPPAQVPIPLMGDDLEEPTGEMAMRREG